MSRFWRRVRPEVVSTLQREAAEATIYILREIGPTGFLLKEENEQKVQKVLIGERHTCSCSNFTRNSTELCKHLCWVLLKKFKVLPSDPISWQLGLCERDINALLKNTKSGVTEDLKVITPKPENMVKLVEQREITIEDSCPICQETLLDNPQKITYCRFGCGNSVHVKCMRVWAAHRKADSIIECPFCRTDFGPITLLNESRYKLFGPKLNNYQANLREHSRTYCHSCGASPIVGKCYKCDYCETDFYLCQPCFKTEIHSEHQFVYRTKVKQKWQPVSNRDFIIKLRLLHLNDIVTRDIVDADYDTLLQLDDQLSGTDGNLNQAVNEIQECHLVSFPTRRLRTNDPLLPVPSNVNQKSTFLCKICKSTFKQGQEVRMVPCCKTWFHRDCIDAWLLHWSVSCPADQTTLTPLEIKKLAKKKKTSTGPTNSESSDGKDKKITIRNVKSKLFGGGGGDSNGIEIRGLNINKISRDEDGGGDDDDGDNDYPPTYARFAGYNRCNVKSNAMSRLRHAFANDTEVKNSLKNGYANSFMTGKQHFLPKLVRESDNNNKNANNVNNTFRRHSTDSKGKTSSKFQVHLANRQAENAVEANNSSKNFSQYAKLNAIKREHSWPTIDKNKTFLPNNTTGEKLKLEPDVRAKIPTTDNHKMAHTVGKYNLNQHYSYAKHTNTPVLYEDDDEYDYDNHIHGNNNYSNNNNDDDDDDYISNNNYNNIIMNNNNKNDDDGDDNDDNNNLTHHHHHHQQLLTNNTNSNDNYGDDDNDADDDDDYDIKSMGGNNDSDDGYDNDDDDDDDRFYYNATTNYNNNNVDNDDDNDDSDRNVKYKDGGC